MHGSNAFELEFMINYMHMLHLGCLFDMDPPRTPTKQHRPSISSSLSYFLTNGIWNPETRALAL